MANLGVIGKDLRSFSSKFVTGRDFEDGDCAAHEISDSRPAF